MQQRLFQDNHFSLHHISAIKTERNKRKKDPKGRGQNLEIGVQIEQETKEYNTHIKCIKNFKREKKIGDGEIPAALFCMKVLLSVCV